MYFLPFIIKGILALFYTLSLHHTRDSNLARMDETYQDSETTPRGTVSVSRDEPPGVSILPNMLSPHHAPVTTLPQALHGIIAGTGKVGSGGGEGTMEGLGWQEAWAVSLVTHLMLSYYKD